MVLSGRGGDAAAGASAEVGADHVPDVVLEVDYATDVRRGKRGLYETWGFPGVWVEVREGGSPRRRRGLTIGGGRTAIGRRRRASPCRAGPRWRFTRPLNEPALSEATRAVLQRVSRVLGATAGTGPDDDPWLGEHRREARAEGPVEGHAADRAEAYVEFVRSILQNRGLDVSERLAARIAGEDPDAVVAAALVCQDEADLVGRLDARRRSGRRKH